MNDELIEVLAEGSHIGWQKEKIAQGYANHTWMTVSDHPNECAGLPHFMEPCSLPKARHHPDMQPYADLDEPTKEYDRATVRGVLTGIAEAGYIVTPIDTLRRLQEAVALLNSMLFSGESHSETSRAVVHSAMSVSAVLR